MEVQPTILLIENDENDVFFFRRCLGAVNARVDVRVVASAWQARDYMVGRGPYHDRRYYALPDIIVTDMNLPGTSGLEFLAWLREEERFRHIPVFVMSGSFGAGAIAGLKDLGIQAHYVKTPDFNKCKSFVTSMLEHLPKTGGEG